MSYRYAVLKDNPVGFYPLDDSADLAPLSNTATLTSVGTSTPIVVGNTRAALIAKTSTIVINNKIKAFSADAVKNSFSGELWFSFNNLMNGQNGYYDWNVNNYPTNNSLNDGSTSNIEILAIKNGATTIALIFYEKMTNTFRFRVYGAGSTYVDSYCIPKDLDTQYHIYFSYSNKSININVNNNPGISAAISDTSLFASNHTSITYRVDGTNLKTSETFSISNLAFYDYLLSAGQLKNHMIWGFNDDKPIKTSLATQNSFFPLEETQDMFGYRKVYSGKNFSNASEIYNLNVTEKGLNPKKLQHGAFNQLETATLAYSADGVSWNTKKCGIDFPDFGSVITVPGTITLIVKPSVSDEYVLSISGVNGESTLYLERASGVYNLKLYDIFNGTTTTLATVNSPGYYDKIAISFTSNSITLNVNSTLQSASTTISFAQNSVLTIGQSYHLGTALVNLRANSSSFSYLSITDEYRTDFPSAGITTVNGYNFGNLRQDVVLNSSVETDISYWSSFAGAGRSANTIAQTSEVVAYSGTKSIKFTPNANKGTSGNRVLTWYESAQGAQVTPGKTYVNSVYFRSPVPTTVRLIGDYKKSDTTYISSISGNPTFVPAGTWTRLFCQGTAPASAGYLALGVAESSQHVFPFRENLITNPSFEVDTTSWAPNTGGTMARSTAQAYSGTASLLFTCSNANSSQGPFIGSGFRPTVTAGQTYTFAMAVKDINTSIQWIARIQWYTATTGGTLISTSDSTPISINSTNWTRVSVTATAPATAVGATVWLVSATTPANGSQLYFDAASFEQESVYNLVSNSNFEQGSGATFTGWAGLADVTISAGVFPQNGSRNMRFTSTSAGNTGTNGINIPMLTPLRTTDVINVSYYARRISGTGQLAVAFDGVGSGYALSAVPTGNLQGDWVRVSGSVSMTGTYMGTQRIYQTVANDIWEIDAFQITRGGTTLYSYTNSDYFDGATGLTYQRWTGTANASTSLDAPWYYADGLMIEESSTYNPTVNPQFQSNTTNWSVNVDTTPGTLTQVSNLSSISTSGLTTAMQVDSPAATRLWNFLMGILDNPTGFFVTGQTYTLSFYARLLSGSSSGYKAWFSNGPSLHQPGPLTTFTPTSSWQRFTFTFTATDNGYTDTMWHIDLPTNAASSAQFTGFQVEKASSASTYTNSTYLGTSLTGGYPWKSVIKYLAPMTADLVIDQKGYWINSFPLTSISNLSGAKIDWTSLNNCIVEYSTDNGSTWYALSRRGGHIPGYDFTGQLKNISLRVTMITMYPVSNYNQSLNDLEVAMYRNLNIYSEGENFLLLPKSRSSSYNSTFTTKTHKYQVLSRPNNLGLLFSYDSFTSSVPGYATIKNLNSQAINGFDLWFRVDSNKTNAKLITGDSAIVGYPDVYIDGSGNFAFNAGVSALYVNGVSVSSGTTAVDTSRPYHITVAINSYTGDLFINGTASNAGMEGSYGFLNIWQYTPYLQDAVNRYNLYVNNNTTIYQNDNLVNSTSNNLLMNSRKDYSIAYKIGV